MILVNVQLALELLEAVGTVPPETLVALARDEKIDEVELEFGGWAKGIHAERHENPASLNASRIRVAFHLFDNLQKYLIAEINVVECATQNVVTK